MAVIIGVTATRRGLTSAQWRVGAVLLEELAEGEAPVLLQGCCVGGDEQLAELVRHLWGRAARVVGLPSSDTPRYRSERAVLESDELRAAEPALARNRRIVFESDVLVACPAGPEELRSGTWSTVREARRKGRLYFVIPPCGAVIRQP